MNLDNLDIKVLRENFDDETIDKIDIDNVGKIFKYLKENDIYYANDLFTIFLDLFLLPYDSFVKQFEKLKNELGNDYVDKLGEDMSLIEIMYQD